MRLTDEAISALGLFGGEADFLAALSHSMETVSYTHLFALCVITAAVASLLRRNEGELALLLALCAAACAAALLINSRIYAVEKSWKRNTILKLDLPQAR